MIKELDIREVANLSGLAPSTLRFYEKKGLIKSWGRQGLRRQYHPNVLNTLQLIALGQAAGFSLNKLATMLNVDGDISLDRTALNQRAREIDITIGQLQRLSQGLKHIAQCTRPEHAECPEFKKTIAKGLKLIK